MYEELVEDYGLDGQVFVMNDSGNVLVGDANLLPTKMEWNSEGYCLTKVGRDSRLVVRKQVKALTVLYLVHAILQLTHFVHVCRSSRQSQAAS